MSNLKKILDSGATLEVTMCPFQEGNKLLKAVMKEAESVKVVLGIKGKTLKDIADLELTDDVLDTVKNIVARLLSSDEIEAALWVCLGRATYNNKKITPETFEDEEARSDYFVVMKEVLGFNLRPFVKNLASLFTGLLEKSINIQKLQ